MGGYSPNHRWYYFPRMTRDEAFLLKTYDSQGEMFKETQAPEYHPDEPPVPAAFAIHSAFADPSSPPGGPKRESVEVRTMVFYK